MKIELFKKENNFKKKDFTFNPNLYWEIAFFCMFVLIGVAFFFGHYLFVQVIQEPTITMTDGNTQTPMVNKSHIEKVLNYFSDRETRTTLISNSPSPVVDPSL